MANDPAHGRSFYRHDEIVVYSRDGAPHFTGERPELLNKYRKRAQLVLALLEGSGDDQQEINASAEKKRSLRFRLLNGLHDKA